MGDRAQSSGAARLSPQQRACLEGVWRLQSSKEIARDLGLSKSTVDGYVAEAVEKLGARNRKDAARLYFGPPPAKSGADETRVVDAADARNPGGTANGDDHPLPRSWWDQIRWPFPTAGRPDNDLSIAAIVVWIVAIGVASLVTLSLAVSIASGIGQTFPPRSLPPHH